MNEVKIAFKILKWVGIVILAIVLLLAILLFILSKKPFVPSNYTKTVETGGELEVKYLAMGQYEASIQKQMPRMTGESSLHTIPPRWKQQTGPTPWW